MQSAIGFDAERGDTVTIESLQFTAPPDAGALVERGGDGFLAAHGARLAQIGVLAAIVLALIFFVLRPMVSRRPLVELAELTGPREIAPIRRAMPARRDRAATSSTCPRRRVTKIERLREVIASRSEDSAAVLRSWIESPETRKEPAGS